MLLTLPLHATLFSTNMHTSSRRAACHNVQHKHAHAHLIALRCAVPTTKCFSSTSRSRSQVGKVYRYALDSVRPNGFYATCRTVRRSPAVNAERTRLVLSGGNSGDSLNAGLLLTRSTCTRVSCIRLTATDVSEARRQVTAIRASLDTNSATLGGVTTLVLQVRRGVVHVVLQARVRLRVTSLSFSRSLPPQWPPVGTRTLAAALLAAFPLLKRLEVACAAYYAEEEDEEEEEEEEEEESPLLRALARSGVDSVKYMEEVDHAATGDRISIDLWRDVHEEHYRAFARMPCLCDLEVIADARAHSGKGFVELLGGACPSRRRLHLEFATAPEFVRCVSDLLLPVVSSRHMSARGLEEVRDCLEAALRPGASVKSLEFDYLRLDLRAAASETMDSSPVRETHARKMHM